MNIDLHNVNGEITSYTQKRTEHDDGESSSLTVTLGLLVQVTTRFLDEYLDGHNSGAQPSSVFWRIYPDEDRVFLRRFS